MDIPVYTQSIGDSLLKGKMDTITSLRDAKKKNLNKEEKAGFEKAARGFESMFVYMMLKEMRQAMLEEKKDDKDSFGGDTLQGMMDMMLSDHVSRVGKGIGIAETFYQNMTGDKLGGITSEAVPDLIHSKTGNVVPLATPKNNKESQPVSGNFIEKMNGRFREFDSIISQASSQYGVPENLIKAIISAESAGRPDARSNAGAKGLMQLMDSTAAELGVKNSFDPKENIFGGAQYIKKMLDNFDGDTELALAAYNAGPGNVQKYGGVPPFPETQAYVHRVKKFNDLFSHGSV
ncbi:MAG: Soluble lytic murein transglycosylase-like protein [Ignavibacteria bacterium]|nr:Soluble lytic murein transglycosylase-like protein [Ignavibacteria bacterium]